MTTLASAGPNPVAITLVWVLIFAAYWAPSIVAWRRHVPSAAQVVIVNLFLGWTFVGWVVALVMAFRAVPQRAES